MSAARQYLMRIALITRRFDASGGGTERDLIATARCLVRAGHEVVIYAGERRGAAGPWNVRQVPARAPGRALSLLRLAYLAPAQARHEGAQITLSFGRTIGADILRSGGGAHCSYVRAARVWRGPAAAAAMWLSPYHRAQMLVERRGFGSSRLRRAIAVSEMVRADLLNQFNLSADKVTTIYNGVDLDRFRPAGVAEKARARQDLGVDQTVPVVIFVGNGFARKGLEFLLRACPGLEVPVLLLIVGGDRAAAAYSRMAQRLGIAASVRFLGPQPDVQRIFAAADALALPSLFEPFGNVVMEAMASGLPVLTSAQSGASELMPPEMRAFIASDPTDVGQLRDTLDALIKAAPNLGEAARSAAEQHTWERHDRELLELIDSVA